MKFNTSFRCTEVKYTVNNILYSPSFTVQVYIAISVTFDVQNVHFSPAHKHSVIAPLVAHSFQSATIMLAIRCPHFSQLHPKFVQTGSFPSFPRELSNVQCNVVMYWDLMVYLMIALLQISRRMPVKESWQLFSIWSYEKNMVAHFLIHLCTLYMK